MPLEYLSISMTTVCIIGAGELGGAVAQALATGEHVSRVRLIDPDAATAAGKALDLQQAGAIGGIHTRLEGTGDTSRATGCQVCVIAEPARPAAQERDSDEILTSIMRIAADTADAPLVFAGTSHARLLLAAAEAGVPRRRLIGSAPEALASAIAAIVAVEARCAPADVKVTVLGSPPDFVVPWSEASVGGYSLDRVVTQVQLTRIEARVARLWPPGPFVLGQAASRIVEAIVRSSPRTCSVLTVLDGEFGVRHRAGTLPASLSSIGIARTRVPTLNTRERVQLEIALGG